MRTHTQTHTFFLDLTNNHIVHMSCLFSSTLPLIEPFGFDDGDDDLLLSCTNKQVSVQFFTWWRPSVVDIILVWSTTNRCWCSLSFIWETVTENLQLFDLGTVLGSSTHLWTQHRKKTKTKKQKKQKKTKKRIGRLQVNIVLQSTNSLWHTEVIQPIGLYEELALYWYTFSNSCVIYCSFNIEYICKGYHNICESHPCSE